MYIVDKNIPSPIGRKRTKVDFLVHLEIGDSFEAPIKTRSGILTLANKYNVKLISRKQSDAICRFWRIE